MGGWIMGLAEALASVNVEAKGVPMTQQADQQSSSSAYPELAGLDPVLTAAQVAAFLKVSKSHVNALVRSGAIRKLPLGDRTLIARHELLRLLTAGD